MHSAAQQRTLPPNARRQSMAGGLREERWLDRLASIQ